MDRTATSYCHVLAPGPQSTQAPGVPCSSFSHRSFLSQPPGSRSLLGELQPPVCVGEVLPTVKTPTVTKSSHPSKGALHTVKSNLFDLVLRWLLSQGEFRSFREAHPFL